jgi:tetratricopeptide (TPR) repeat protein
MVIKTIATCFLGLAQLVAQTTQGAGGQPQQDLSGRGIRVESRVRKATAQMVPRGYALIVGVAKYPKMSEENNKLRFPERDAAAIHDVLTSQEGGNFAPENVRTLIGEKATLANIRRELEEWLPSVAREGDRVLVYFAGHAFLLDGKGYLASHDAELERLQETAYPMERLGQVFGSRIKAKWKMLLTDACHSGAITPETSNEAVNEKLASVEKNMLSLTASRKRESSYEDPQLGGGHGLFSYFLVQGLKGQADRDRDGLVTADELIDYVRNHVREYAQQRSAQQTPTESGDFDPDLILAFNPKTAAESDSAPTLADGTLVVESNKEEVEFLLDGKPMGVVSPGKPLTLPGISAGVHTVQGVKKGYDPDGPRQVLVYPGKETPVSLRIQFARVRKKAAAADFEEGRKLYNRGSTAECKQAAALFAKALAEDDKFSEAALYLGRTYQVMFDSEQALKYLRMAVDLDPDYVEAHISLGSMLLDTGNTDEAVQHLRYAATRDPRNSLARSHLSQAYRMAGAYDKAVEEAQEGLKLDSSNAQALLWLGDSLRALNSYDEARAAYRDYVRLTDFDATTTEKIGFYLLSNPFTSVFSKKRATQKQVYQDQRNIGFFGLCDCEHRLGNFARAENFCRKALSYDPDDIYSYFKLGRIALDVYNKTSSRDALMSARSNFAKMLALNSEVTEAEYARKYLQAIDQTIEKLARR